MIVQVKNNIRDARYPLYMYTTSEGMVKIEQAKPDLTLNDCIYNE